MHTWHWRRKGRCSWESAWRRWHAREARRRTWRHHWYWGSWNRRSRYGGSGVCLRCSSIYGTLVRVSWRRCRGLVGAHEGFVRFELSTKFIFRKWTVLRLRPFRWRLCDRTSCETQFDFLATLVVCDIWGWNTLHAKYLDLIPITSRECVFDAWKIFRLKLVNLLYVNCETTSSV
jgi:hypothetical protein